MTSIKKLTQKRLKKNLIRVGQISTAILVVFGVLWIPFIKEIANGRLFSYLQSVQAYISPPIAAVFILGILNKKLNAKGATARLWSGFVLGITRLVLEIFKDSLQSSAIAQAIIGINFLHFAIILFIVCSLVHLIVSSITAGDDKDLSQITMSWEKKSTATNTPTSDIIWSVALALSVFGIWLYFS